MTLVVLIADKDAIHVLVARHLLVPYPFVPEEPISLSFSALAATVRVVYILRRTLRLLPFFFIKK